MPFETSDGYSSGSYVPGGRRSPLVDRGPLLEEISARYPDVEGDLLPHLEQRYRSAVARALMLPEDDPELDSYMEQYGPVWENEAQRQAMMAVAASPGGMEKIRKAFPGEYDRGEVRPDQVDSLLPPYARRAMEARRDLEYYRRLQDKERPLTDADVAIGRLGGGNLLRDDKTNWFDTVAREGSDGRMTAFGGPNYFHAQEHPVGIEVAMNPNAPVTTAVLGAMNLIPSLTRHSVGQGELAVDRAMGDVGNNLAYNYMTEMPTANIAPVNSRGRVPLGNAAAAQTNKIRNLLTMQAAQADQGKQFLENFGVPDKYNTDAAAFAADTLTDFVDHTGPRALASGVVRKVDRVPLKPRLSAEPLLNDLKNEVAMSAGMGGYGGTETGSESLSPAERGMAREEKRAMALADLSRHVPQGYVAEAVGETNPVFQKMTMTNPHLQADRLRLARERYEARRQVPQEKPPLFERFIP